MAQLTSSQRLSAPCSNNTVRVRMVDTTAVMTLHSSIFIQPVVPGHEVMSAPDVAFLIENQTLGQKVMFDLGVRKDYWNLPPSIQNRFDKIAVGLRVDKDVKDILLENKIALESINSIIWSHTHWDHTGDTTPFPSSTTLVHGPGISQTGPFYPTNPNSPLPESLFLNRPTIEINFSDTTNPQNLTIGSFPAHDFFGDSSFYLLSTPGHAQGHMCALARTTPDTFILMGGDVCHFCGDMRPSAIIPIPDPIPSGILHAHNSLLPSPLAPCAFFLDEHPQFREHAANTDPATRARTPYYQLSTTRGTAYDTPSPEVAQATIKTLTTNFDGAANVLVCLAHDMTLVERLPTLNELPEEDLNAWCEKGWKELCHWGWLNDVPKRGVPGRSRIVEGFWREGKKFDTARQMLDAFEDTRERSGKL